MQIDSDYLLVIRFVICHEHSWRGAKQTLRAQKATGTYMAQLENSGAGTGIRSLLKVSLA